MNSSWSQNNCILTNVCGQIYVAGGSKRVVVRYYQVRLKAPTFATYCPTIKTTRYWVQFFIGH